MPRNFAEVFLATGSNPTQLHAQLFVSKITGNMFESYNNIFGVLTLAFNESLLAQNHVFVYLIINVSYNLARLILTHIVSYYCRMTYKYR